MKKCAGVKYEKEFDLQKYIDSIPSETNKDGKKYLKYLEYSNYQMPDNLKFEDFERNFKSMYSETDKLLYVYSNYRKFEGDWKNNFATPSEIIDGVKDSYVNQKSCEGGATFKCNPFNFKKVSERNFAGDEFIKSFNYCVIEVDSFDNAKVPIDIQYNFIKSLKIPYSMITFSGKKSLHVLVPLNAKNIKEYKERQTILYNICKANGLDIDPACKNVGRETRLPFVYRNNILQRLVDVKENSEYKSFTDWYLNFASQYVLENFWDETKRFSIRDICNSELLDVFYYEGQHYYELKSMNGTFQRVDRFRLIDEIKKHLKDPVSLYGLLNSYGKKTLTLDMIDIPNKKPQFIITLDEIDGIKNLYKPGFIKEIYENPNPFINKCPSEWEKLLDNLAGPEEKEWLINHLSCYFNTFKNSETIPVFIGKQGTGKDTFAEAIGKCIGMFLSVDSIVLTDRFNDYLLHGCILFNEASVSSRETRSMSNRLKLLTNQTVSIEMKGKSRFETINNSYKFIASNDDDIGASIKIEDHDRRYCFITGGHNLNAFSNNITDYKLLIEQTMEFCYYIKNYNYDETKARIPLFNKMKEEQLMAGKSDLELSIREFLEDNDNENITTEALLQYLESNGIKNANNTNIGKIMTKRLGYCKKKRKVNGILKMCYFKENQIDNI